MVQDLNNYEADNEITSSDVSNSEETNEFLEIAEENLTIYNELDVDYTSDYKPEIVEPEIVEPEIVEPEIVEPEIVEPEIVEPEIVEPEKNDINFNNILNELHASLELKHLQLKTKIKETYDKKLEKRQKKYGEDVLKIDHDFQHIEVEFNNKYDTLIAELGDVYTKYKNKDQDEIMQHHTSLDNYQITKINTLKDNLSAIITNLDFDTTW